MAKPTSLKSAAALLGAKGGAAGRGAAKVRGDSAYYRNLRLTGLARVGLTGLARVEEEAPAGIIQPSEEDPAVVAEHTGQRLPS